MRPISIEDLRGKGADGLMKCHCPCYLKNAWCKHAFSLAKSRGIVDYPEDHDPRQVFKGPVSKVAAPKRGSTTKARRGGHWDKENRGNKSKKK